MTEPEAGDVVAYVEWVDSGIVTGKWTDREEALQDAIRVIAGLVRSSGFLLGQTDDHIVLGLAVNRNNDDVGLVMVIPRVCIRRMDIWSPTRSADALPGQG